MPGRNEPVPCDLGSHGLNPCSAGGQGWLHAKHGGHGPKVLVGCEDGANCRSCSRDQLLILVMAAPSIPNPLCPKSARFGSWAGVLGVGELGTGHASPAAGARGAAEPHAGTSGPPPPAPQPPIYQKAINSLHPAQVLQFLSLPADCRAVIRVCLMRFSWQGYGLSPYLPIRQRLCHGLWCQHNFFLAVFTAIHVR